MAPKSCSALSKQGLLFSLCVSSPLYCQPAAPVPVGQGAENGLLLQFADVRITPVCQHTMCPAAGAVQKVGEGAARSCRCRALKPTVSSVLRLVQQNGAALVLDPTAQDEQPGLAAAIAALDDKGVPEASQLHACGWACDGGLAQLLPPLQEGVPCTRGRLVRGWWPAGVHLTSNLRSSGCSLQHELARAAEHVQMPD